MTDTKIGVYRPPGTPDPWQQDGPPWLEGWDIVGPVAPAPVDQSRYMTSSDRGCAAAPVEVPSATPDRPWCGPWEWVLVDRCYWYLRGMGRRTAIQALMSGSRTHAYNPDGNGGTDTTLAAALAHIRSLSSDPVPDPPAEVWEMCGEAVPDGWVYMGHYWWNGGPGHLGLAVERLREPDGREWAAGICVRDGLPPLPEAAFA